MRLLVAIIFFALTASTAFALDSQSILKDGWEHFNNKNYNTASKTFENAARIDPASSDALKGLGMSYMKMGYSENSTDFDLVEKAAFVFQKALQLDPNMPEVIYQLGLACLALDDKSGAEKQYQALTPISKPLADQLAVKISAYKKPIESHYLYNENNLAGDQREAMQDLVRQKAQAEINKQRVVEAAKAEERAEKKRLISAVEDARAATAIAEYQASRAGAEVADRSGRANRTTIEDPRPINTGAINPHTGEFLAPAGNGYVGTRDGTYYAPSGTGGVINTRTGGFAPVH
ncbi:hypothetical protein EG832_01330 [bacterium]|nr:hypothetical protein [bacterium]